MRFAPIIRKANNLVFNKVHRTDDRLEIPYNHLDCSVREISDLWIGRMQL
nr:hypothetical protein [uncultured Mediterranean phage uvMED]